jgi:hypothetical protein
MGRMICHLPAAKGAVGAANRRDHASFLPEYAYFLGNYQFYPPGGAGFRILYAPKTQKHAC